MSETLLIGERLNTHRPSLAKHVAERNSEAVIKELQRQLDAGVSHVDVNASGSKTEAADLEWLLETLLPVLPAPVGVLIDSADPSSSGRALQKIGRRTNTVLNGITGDAATQAEMLRLARTYDTGVVAILTATGVAARSADERMALAEGLRAKLDEAAIPEERQFFDPHVLPAAYDPLQPRAVLECVRRLRAHWPKSRIIAGISNVSFNMPNRSLLNRHFLAMLLANGADALLCDPCDKDVREAFAAARALAGKDDFFTDYLGQFAQ